jgi:hypothetical protein
MSVGFKPKNELTQNQALEVQELAVNGSDFALYSVAGSVITIYVREPVRVIENGFIKIDSSNTMHDYSMANMAIVDTNGALSGYNEFGQQVSDQGAITLTGVSALNPNDCLVIKYKVAAHL